MQKIIITFISVLTLAGCANPGIVKLSPDTYMLAKADRGGIFGNASALKAEVIQEANSFAEQMGKVAIPIAASEVGLAPGRFATFEYQFRVVDKSDPEARRTSLVPRANLVVEKTEKIVADIKTKDQTIKPKDTYAELIKLDDLRKRGILNEEEFNVQKAKLLEGR